MVVALVEAGSEEIGTKHHAEFEVPVQLTGGRLSVCSWPSEDWCADLERQHRGQVSQWKVMKL